MGRIRGEEMSRRGGERRMVGRGGRQYVCAYVRADASVCVCDCVEWKK